MADTLSSRRRALPERGIARGVGVEVERGWIEGEGTVPMLKDEGGEVGELST